MKAQLRGQGYMKKGGHAATQLHNRAALAGASSVTQHPQTATAFDPVGPTPDTARTRASAVAVWPLIASAWIAGLGMGGSATLLVQALAG